MKDERSQVQHSHFYATPLVNRVAIVQFSSWRPCCIRSVARITATLLVQAAGGVAGGSLDLSKGVVY